MMIFKLIIGERHCSLADLAEFQVPFAIGVIESTDPRRVEFTFDTMSIACEHYISSRLNLSIHMADQDLKVKCSFVKNDVVCCFIRYFKPKTNRHFVVGLCFKNDMLCQGLLLFDALVLFATTAKAEQYLE